MDAFWKVNKNTPSGRLLTTPFLFPFDNLAQYDCILTARWIATPANTHFKSTSFRCFYVIGKSCGDA